MKKIRLTESDLKNVIKNSVKRILRENYHLDNFTGSEPMEEDGQEEFDPIEEEEPQTGVIDILREKESDYDMLNYPEVEEISLEELAACVSEIIEKAKAGGEISSSVGYNTITVDGDTLYLECDDNGYDAYETWAGDIHDIITPDEDLDHIVDTIAASINQCWVDAHDEELEENN